ncbi:MAG: hypothetical protein H0T11_00380, partial [Chthoniobacterales bacterium]|nr:hypothetical protein [Chthoniobacterales bacterium]
MRAFIPVESIEDLAALSEVEFARPASIPVTNAGSVTSQGDATHRAGLTRSTTGANGAGVKVGVLSDTLMTAKIRYPGRSSPGDVDPNNSFILQGQAGVGSAEGLAMCEIVHDLAPASPIVFAT